MSGGISHGGYCPVGICPGAICPDTTIPWRHRWFCSTTKYSLFMIYLHLQNRLISNSHCSTYYNKLLYVCEGEFRIHS